MHRAEDPQFFDLVASSYRRLLGVDLPFLVPGADARWLYAEAPVCVLAHSAESDPRFIYANQTAQDIFEYSWNEFVALPSRLSAEAPEREERQRLLDAVARDGFAAGHSGIRIAKSGRRFWIEDCTLWQLRDMDATLHGVAAWFSSWRDV